MIYCDVLRDATSHMAAELTSEPAKTSIHSELPEATVESLGASVFSPEAMKTLGHGWEPGLFVGLGQGLAYRQPEALGWASGMRNYPTCTQGRIAKHRLTFIQQQQEARLSEA